MTTLHQINQRLKKLDKQVGARDLSNLDLVELSDYELASIIWQELRAEAVATGEPVPTIQEILDMSDEDLAALVGESEE